MALVIADRVRETSTTTGTGTLTLDGAVTGFRTFSSAVGNTNTCYYAISIGSDYEIGIGTVGAGTLARTTILKSSNSNSAVNFGAGSKDVFLTYPGEKAIYKDASGNVNELGTISSGVWNGTVITVPYGGTGVATLTGIVKGNGTSAFSAATAGTDYLAPPSGTSILKANSGGALANATAGTDYLAPPSGTAILKANSGGALVNAVAGTDYLAPAAIGVTVQAWDADLDTWSGKSAPTGSVLGTTDTQTLTNKRITPRVSTTTSSATPTINTDNVDQYGLTAQTVDITSFTTNLSGTPTDGQKLWIYIVGTAARAITWGASFEASTVALPTTTVSTNRLDVGFVWNAATSKWRCVAVA